jgi:tRNA pseudouridine55 synthase
MEGILALFKPKGLTSAAFLHQFKSFILAELKVPGERERKRKRIKVGHGGTLDKGAEGVLVVGIGNGCKELKRFLEGNKKYHVTAKLGIATDTYDSSGTITAEMPYESITYDGFISVLTTKFTGSIQQKPPVLENCVVIILV